ncbi:MAG: hypothetical protein WCX73_05395 [Candidatus Pacearchaeota archaeon]|jgi:hypothetical protein
MAEKLEYTKFRERLDFAIELLQEKFGNFKEVNQQAYTMALMHEASEIAKTLFVRSEIQYSGKKQ